MNFNLELPSRVVRETLWPSQGLAIGAKGPDVKRMQEWLCLHGHATALDGDYGPATKARVAEFARRQGQVSITGNANVSLLTDLSLPLDQAFCFSPGASKMREAVVKLAEWHLPKRPREVGGDNRGPWVRAYCGRDGADYAWCCGFASSLLHQAALSLKTPPPLAFTLGCDELAAYAESAGRLSHTPKGIKPGDLFLVQNPKNKADLIHVGIITAVERDYVATIEGNTNDDGSPNGYEVCARTRGLGGKSYILLG